MRLFILLIGLLWSTIVLAERTIDVRIFSNVMIQQAWVSASQGPYVLISETGGSVDTICSLQPDSFTQVLHISYSRGVMTVNYGEKELGSHTKLRMLPLNDSACFVIKGKGRERIYSGALLFECNGLEVYLINRVHIEDYVAGVVESEGGHVDQYEYFKAQAILARTWAMRNMNKHLKEGYNVKDDVTSQAYYSKAYLQNSKAIIKAVNTTRDTILVDMDGKVVFGAFHANSGGQTVNSEDVWQGSISYLRSAPDSFSLAGKKAFWEKQLDKEEFIQFFADKLKQSNSDTVFRAAVLSIDQKERMPFFFYNGQKLKMRWVRQHFRLRSTFFTLVDEGETVLLKGRGFGHGIGMSQEGAMRMSELGYSYQEILSHYFKGVKFAVIPQTD